MAEEVAGRSLETTAGVAWLGADASSLVADEAVCFVLFCLFVSIKVMSLRHSKTFLFEFIYDETTLWPTRLFYE